MDTGSHALPELFAQLGLETDPQSIEQFIQHHDLPTGLSITKAPFWSDAQAAFLKESIAQDSDWAPAVDELATALNHPKAKTDPLAHA